jgi:hypothetical protein
MIDFTKPIQTRDGHPVEIISTNLRGPHPVIGYVGNSKTFDQWTAEGKYALGAGCFDLVNVPEKRVIWLNVYERGMITRHDSRHLADEWVTRTASKRTECIRVEYEVGQRDD